MTCSVSLSALYSAAFYFSQLLNCGQCNSFASTNLNGTRILTIGFID